MPRRKSETKIKKICRAVERVIKKLPLWFILSFGTFELGSLALVVLLFNSRLR